MNETVTIPLGRVFECACGLVVVERDGVRYAPESGNVHACLRLVK